MSEKSGIPFFITVYPAKPDHTCLPYSYTFPLNFLNLCCAGVIRNLIKDNRIPFTALLYICIIPPSKQARNPPFYVF